MPQYQYVLLLSLVPVKTFWVVNLKNSLKNFVLWLSGINSDGQVGACCLVWHTHGYLNFLLADSATASKQESYFSEGSPSSASGHSLSTFCQDPVLDLIFSFWRKCNVSSPLMFMSCFTHHKENTSVLSMDNDPAVMTQQLQGFLGI